MRQPVRVFHETVELAKAPLRQQFIILGTGLVVIAAVPEDVLQAMQVQEAAATRIRPVEEGTMAAHSIHASPPPYGTGNIIGTGRAAA
ncbi:MAG TPA: hypothetical protein VHP11_17535 [Tepidisphaeraceae bacterium]|nr:hypothetical protein [Tepidisphaeraceae bacterium]